MRAIGVLNKAFSARFVRVLVLTIATAAALSSATFLLTVSGTAGETYSQQIASIAGYKQAALKSSVAIYLLFGSVASVAVALFSVYFSHRVAGPLVRIRRFTNDMKLCDFGGDVRFRSGDAIKPLAEAAEEFSRKYSGLYSNIEGIAGELHADIAELESSCISGDAVRLEALLDRVDSNSRALHRILSEIKV